MIALEERLNSSPGAEDGCVECRGTGIVSYWSEFSYFEDRRSCRHCEAGFKIEQKIADIITRVQAEERANKR